MNTKDFKNIKEPSVDFKQDKIDYNNQGDPKAFVEEIAERNKSHKQDITGELTGVSGNVPDSYGRDSDEKIVERGGQILLFKKHRGKWYRVALTKENT